jgi:hypothetical protein
VGENKNVMTEQDSALVAIREAIVLGTRDFLAIFRHNWAGERLYGFMLEAVWEGTSVEAVAGTEEGLLRTAQHYARLDGKLDQVSINRQKIELRRGSPEDGWYASYDEDCFEKTN